jgi:hypothetical protein
MPNTVKFVSAQEGAQFHDVGTDYQVAPSCGAEQGQWYCITCKRTFRNQFEKDTHADSGEHVLTWVCLEHGPEVP